MMDWQRRLLKLQLWSLLPVSIAAIFNVGYQYLQAPTSEFDDMRSRIARGLGASFENPGIYDFASAGLAHLVPTLVIAVIIGGLWERSIAERRGRPFELTFIPIALLFTLLLPAAPPLLHVAFGMSFAILVGKAIFGGTGKTFLSPALLGIVIVQVSFPGVAGDHPSWQGLAGYSGSDAVALYFRGGEAALAAADITIRSTLLGYVPGPVGVTSILAILAGAIVLLVARHISWRLLAAQVIGVVLCAGIFTQLGPVHGAYSMPPGWHLLLGSFAFGAVYLACDPFAACCTNPGRWIQGLLIGALVVLIREVNPTHPDAVFAVILLVSILAPLIDHAVIAWSVRQRARRHV